jgi:hypothetical protein
MSKTLLLAAAIMIAGSASTALAQSRPAPMPSDATLRAACDRALAARGRADASSAVRQRCVTILRARVAHQRKTKCFYTRDMRHRGWSHGAQAFNFMSHYNRWPCPNI